MEENTLLKDPELMPLLYEGIQLTRPLLRYITSAVDVTSQKHGVSVGERAVLEVLLNSESPLTAPAITERLDLKRQFVARVLTACKTAGFVKTQANPDHVRSHFYVLTTKGRTAICAIRGAEQAILEELLQSLTADEVRAHLKVQKALFDYFASLASS